MREDSQALANLLRRLAETVERSTPTELAALLEGDAEIALNRVKPRRGSQRAHSNGTSGPDRDLAAIVSELRELTSRVGGLNLLDRSDLSKKDLEDLARLMDLPVLREDSSERLRQRIVEQSIGARLNSQAIRKQRG
jgi:hypothetical protein